MRKWWNKEKMQKSSLNFHNQNRFFNKRFLLSPNSNWIVYNTCYNSQYYQSIIIESSFILPLNFINLQVDFVGGDAVLFDDQDPILKSWMIDWFCDGSFLGRCLFPWISPSSSRSLKFRTVWCIDCVLRIWVAPISHFGRGGSDCDIVCSISFKWWILISIWLEPLFEFTVWSPGLVCLIGLWISTLLRLWEMGLFWNGEKWRIEVTFWVGVLAWRVLFFLHWMVQKGFFMLVWAFCFFWFNLTWVVWNMLLSCYAVVIV